MDQPTGRHRTGRRASSGRRGNAVAIALASLAVVLAGTGTAVAVTSATVLTDPSYPARKARIDTLGRLTVTEPLGTINVATTAYTNASKNLDVFSAPTTAGLAVSKFSVVNSSNNVGKYAIYLFQVPVNTDGSCSLTVTTRTLAFATVAPGTQTVQEFATPIVTHSIGGAKYCLDLYAQAENSSTAPASEALNVQLVAYAADGSYSGLGTGAAARVQSKAKATGKR